MLLTLKIIIVLLFFIIAFNLFKALLAMLKNKQDLPMSHFIGRRLWLSIAVVFIFIGLVAFGAIVPNPTPY